MSSSPFDRDDIRKLIEMSESPTIRHLREMENTPAMQAARLLEQSGLQKLASSVILTRQAFDAYTRSEQWAELSGAIARVHADLRRPETLAAIEQIDKNLKTIALTANGAILPLAARIQTFSEAAARAVRPLQEHFAQMEAWQSSLAERMTALTTPWALEEHLGVSVVGFARIARLHDLSVGGSPFDPATSEILDEELGEPVPYDAEAEPEDREAARIDAGLNPEIVAFPADVYPGVLFAAGFELRIEAIAPVRSEGGDDSGVFDPQHAGLLRQVENRLRELIETELRRLARDGWQRRIHGDVRKKWQDRKTRDHDQRGDSYSLLFYADFMDLADVICQGNNWNEAFQQFFTSKQDFLLSMQRLSPVRNAIGHNRPLVRADQVTLFSEAFRMLRALGVKL